MAWLTGEAEQLVQSGDCTLALASVPGGQIARDAESLTSSFTGWELQRLMMATGA